ncbi:hypothetical protein ACJX0J_040808 [Zea mays]
MKISEDANSLNITAVHSSQNLHFFVKAQTQLQDHVCIIGNNFLIHTYYLSEIHGHATREECAFMQTNIFEIDIVSQKYLIQLQGQRMNEEGTNTIPKCSKICEMHIRLIRKGNITMIAQS